MLEVISSAIQSGTKISSAPSKKSKKHLVSSNEEVSSDVTPSEEENKVLKLNANTSKDKPSDFKEKEGPPAKEEPPKREMRLESNILSFEVKKSYTKKTCRKEGIEAYSKATSIEPLNIKKVQGKEGKEDTLISNGTVGILLNTKEN